MWRADAACADFAQFKNAGPQRIRRLHLSVIATDFRWRE